MNSEAPRLRAGIPHIGIALGGLNPAFHLEATLEAERLGFESVWLPEHLVFPVEMAGSPLPGKEHPPVPPSTPVFDCFAYLSFLAGRTERIRLGTNIYLMGLRHPFVAARAVQTLDLVSGGRAEVGIGAGWLASEWRAAGLPFASRGPRLEETLAVCKRLWSEEVVNHHGAFYEFEPVMFEPKPVQRPWPRIHVGGESRAALARAARLADGWMGLAHTLASAPPLIERMRALVSEHAGAREQDAGARSRPFQVSLGAAIKERDDLERWAEAGVDRIVATPWRRSRDAVDGLRRLAELASD